MVGIILASHGEFANGILQSGAMIFGDQVDVKAVTLQPSEGPDDLKAKMEAAIATFENQDEVLFLVDLWGGTPFNQANGLIAGHEDKWAIVTGLNLPMLIETYASRMSMETAHEIAKHVTEVAREGVKVKPEELEPETPKVTADEVAKVEGSVTFADVNFGYLKDQTIINDFSLHVHAGQTVAIVGPTGAGKTTIVKLLMRFYELNSGSILIDGKDIRDFGRQDLRSLFGMVLQDTWLFNGTIKENLMYGKLDASDEEVKEACKVAYVDHFVQTLENGYETMINEESSNISQGQKQLLTIARAFLKDPKILILDEATSSVDTRTEVLIQKGMEKLMEGRTSFVIAHRLSTIRDADTIIVMKDGDIVELGNHDSLLAKDGFYASLYRSQFEGSDE